MARVLYLSYNGLGEPLAHSQILPYLRRLAATGYPSSLVTFEKPHHINRRQFAEWRAQLAQQGIAWRWLRYHKRPAVPATLYDIARGIVAGWRLARRHRVQLIHARASIAGVMGWVIAKLCRKPFLYDIRGLNAEEYVDGSGWSRSSLRYRTLRWLEGRMCHDATALVVLTEWVRGYLTGGRYTPHPVPDGKITVIPCCTDLGRFRFSPGARRRLRERLGLERNTVAIYVGQLGSWYLLEEMARFVAAGRQADPSVRLVLVTPTDPGEIWPVLMRCGWTRQDAVVLAAEPSEVPAYLSAADVGLSFIKPDVSKRSSSPTKIGEYLACGLPVVANAGVGDMERLFDGRGIGALVEGFSGEEFAAAWRRIEALRKEGEPLRARCRRAAQELFDLQTAVERYAGIYARCLGDVHNRGAAAQHVVGAATA